MDVLNNIEKYILFVKNTDKERIIIQSSAQKISLYSPSIFIVSGISSAASLIRNCEVKLIELLREYELEKISSEEKENLFFKRRYSGE